MKKYAKIVKKGKIRMENEIKVNDYVRTSHGEIFKVLHLTKQNQKYLFVDRPVDRNEDRAENDNALCKNEIINHSPNLIDIIEER